MELNTFRPVGGKFLRRSHVGHRLFADGEHHRRRAFVAFDALRSGFVADHVRDEIGILDERRIVDEALRHLERTRVVRGEVQAARMAAHHFVPAVNRLEKRVLHERPALREMPVAAGAERRKHERGRTLGVVRKEVKHALVGEICDAAMLIIHSLLELDCLHETCASTGGFKARKQLLERDGVVLRRLLREARKHTAERGFKGA